MDTQLASFGPFRLFAAERQLKKGDEEIPLGGRALDTLIALVEHAGQVVTQRELISRVWPDVTVEEANLRFHISNLRKVLGDGREGARWYCQLKRPWYARRVGGAAARVEELLCSPIMLPRSTERGRRKAPWVR